MNVELDPRNAIPFPRAVRLAVQETLPGWYGLYTVANMFREADEAMQNLPEPFASRIQYKDPDDLDSPELVPWKVLAEMEATARELFNRAIADGKLPIYAHSGDCFYRLPPSTTATSFVVFAPPGGIDQICAVVLPFDEFTNWQKQVRLRMLGSPKSNGRYSAPREAAISCLRILFPPNGDPGEFWAPAVIARQIKPMLDDLMPKKASTEMNTYEDRVKSAIVALAERGEIPSDRIR